MQQSFLIFHVLKVQPLTDWVKSNKIPLQTPDCQRMTPYVMKWWGVVTMLHPWKLEKPVMGGSEDTESGNWALNTDFKERPNVIFCSTSDATRWSGEIVQSSKMLMSKRLFTYSFWPTESPWFLQLAFTFQGCKKTGGLVLLKHLELSEWPPSSLWKPVHTNYFAVRASTFDGECLFIGLCEGASNLLSLGICRFNIWSIFVCKHSIRLGSASSPAPSKSRWCSTPFWALRTTHYSTFCRIV